MTFSINDDSFKHHFQHMHLLIQTLFNLITLKDIIFLNLKKKVKEFFNLSYLKL